MKKHSLLITLIVLLLLLSGLDTKRPFTGVTLQKASSKVQLEYAKTYPNYDILERMIYIPSEVEDWPSLTKMIFHIQSIERPILQRLEAAGVKIRLFQGDLTDEPWLYHLKWEHPRGWKSPVTWEDVPGSGGSWLISAKIGASDPGNGHRSVNLELHEIGHTIYELLNNNDSLISDFEKIWKNEVSHLFGDQEYFNMYSSEYFSESFAYYYTNEDLKAQLNKVAPETATFISKLATYRY